MTMRLSIMSFAGMVRTLVAVGTVRLASMFAARVLLMPRRGRDDVFGRCGGLGRRRRAARVWGASAGIGCGLAGDRGGAGDVERVRMRGCGLVAGAPRDGAASARCLGQRRVSASRRLARRTAAARRRTPGSRRRCRVGDRGGSSREPATSYWSTEFLSTRYRSYISSTSHSLAPNSPELPSSGPTSGQWARHS